MLPIPKSVLGTLLVVLVGRCGPGFMLVDGDCAAAWEQDAGPSSTDVASAQIGPSGGQVASASARLVFPAGALSGLVEIRVSCRDGRPEGSEGVVCDFGPDGLAFATPIEVHLALEGVPSDAHAKRLRVGTLVDGAWVRLPTSRYDSASGEVVGLTTHFSTYGILLQPCEPPDCDATDLVPCEGPECLPPELRNAWTARMSAMLLPTEGDQPAAEIPFDPYVAGLVDLTRLEGSACRDLSGDGVLDSGVGKNVAKLGVLWGGDPSTELTAALFHGAWNLILDFHVVSTEPDKPTGLAFYLAERDADVNAAGQPYQALGGVNNPLGELQVEIDGETFRATGNSLRITYVLETVPLVFPIADPVVSGTFVATQEGRDIRDGALTGVLYRADVRASIEAARALCAETTPTPWECPYIDQLSPLFTGSYFTYDLDVPVCDRLTEGEPDCAAMSVCAYFAAVPAQIEVLVPGP